MVRPTEEIYKVVDAHREMLRALLELGQDGGIRDMPNIKITKAYQAIMQAKMMMQPEFSLEEIEAAQKQITVEEVSALFEKLSAKKLI